MFLDPYGVRLRVNVQSSFRCHIYRDTNKIWKQYLNAFHYIIHLGKMIALCLEILGIFLDSNDKFWP